MTVFHFRDRRSGALRSAASLHAPDGTYLPDTAEWQEKYILESDPVKDAKAAALAMVDTMRADCIAGFDQLEEMIELLTDDRFGEE